MALADCLCEDHSAKEQFFVTCIVSYVFWEVKFFSHLAEFLLSLRNLSKKAFTAVFACKTTFFKSSTRVSHAVWPNTASRRPTDSLRAILRSDFDPDSVRVKKITCIINFNPGDLSYIILIVIPIKLKFGPLNRWCLRKLHHVKRGSCRNIGHRGLRNDRMIRTLILLKFINEIKLNFSKMSTGFWSTGVSKLSTKIATPSYRSRQQSWRGVTLTGIKK